MVQSFAAPGLPQAEKKISLDINDATITEVFSVIEKKTGFTFIFDDKISANSKRISVHVENEIIDGVLKVITGKTGITFKKINNTITATKTDLPQVVKGKITDDQGMPLPGATVMEKGTKNRAGTDIDGNFSLTVSDASATLVIAYIGFETQQIEVHGKSIINVSLKPSANEL